MACLRKVLIARLPCNDRTRDKEGGAIGGGEDYLVGEQKSIFANLFLSCCFQCDRAMLSRSFLFSGFSLFNKRKILLLWQLHEHNKVLIEVYPIIYLHSPGGQNQTEEAGQWVRSEKGNIR